MSQTRHLSDLINVRSQIINLGVLFVIFNTTDIQTVVNCFDDCSQFVNNTERSGNIARYFVDIFRHCALFDLPMSKAEFSFKK